MELDVLYAHIASPPVVTGLPALARRIAHKELPHGANIIVGIHARLLKERHPLPSTPPTPCVPPPLSPSFSFTPPPSVSFKFGPPSPPIADAPSDTIEIEFAKPAPTSFGQWGECGFGEPAGSSNPDFGAELQRPIQTVAENDLKKKKKKKW